MSETIDEITINWEDDNGQLITKELKKEVLTRGSWTTIVFMYQDLDRKNGGYGAPKLRIGRYQKRNGEYRQQSKFNISSVAQATQLKELFDAWIPEMENVPTGEEAADTKSAE